VEDESIFQGPLALKDDRNSSRKVVFNYQFKFFLARNLVSSGKFAASLPEKLAYCFLVRSA
jgi:hypothetical protein